MEDVTNSISFKDAAPAPALRRRSYKAERIELPPPAAPPTLPFCWDRFITEGDTLFTYLIEHFDRMISPENTRLRHFQIRDCGFTGPRDEDDLVKEKYEATIETDLVPWILEEHATRRLLKKENWRPFRDNQLATSMYAAYKILFKHENYYFQLVMDDCCGVDHSTCPDCQAEGHDHPHFDLALYAWIDEDGVQQPFEDVPIPGCCTMPAKHWRIA
jgi:hypothetical protein